MMKSASMLAIDGGPSVRSTPWPPWPHFTPREITLASAVLESGRVNYWTGEYGRQFESEYAAYLGAPYAIAVSNGTVALELALRSLGVGPGDEVVVPCRTFMASASCVVAVGATPVLCDVDLTTQTMSVETVSAVLTQRTRAIIAVHLAGMPCRVDELLALSKTHGLFLIEDCAQAHGARVLEAPVGSIGHAAAFSFCQDKIITTAGEGGMLVLRDERAFEVAVRFKDHGKSPALMRDAAAAATGCFAFVHDSFGSNLRMTEVQAAIGLDQLRRLDESVSQRRTNAAYLRTGLESVSGMIVDPVPPWAYHAYYKCYIRVDGSVLASGWSRDRILRAMVAEGVPIGSGSCPDLGMESAFQGFATATVMRPMAAALSDSTLMFQVHPTLCASDMDDCVEAARRVMAFATSERGPR